MADLIKNNSNCYWVCVRHRLSTALKLKSHGCGLICTDISYGATDKDYDIGTHALR